MAGEALFVKSLRQDMQIASIIGSIELVSSCDTKIYDTN